MARKPVRSPFVVTVAVMAAACGGQVSPDHSATGHSATGDAGADTEAHADAPPEKTCPSARPEVGSACRVDPSLFCEFGSCSPGSYPVVMSCEGSTWRESGRSSCNPPPPECPPIPYEGAPCKAGWGDCGYPDKCESKPADAPSYRSWQCVGDRLVRRDTTTDYVVACPALAPRNGDPCACAGHYAGPCSYGDCYGVPTATARCDERTMTWIVGVSSCNPPPPDAG